MQSQVISFILKTYTLRLWKQMWSRFYSGLIIQHFFLKMKVLPLGITFLSVSHTPGFKILDEYKIGVLKEFLIKYIKIYNKVTSRKLRQVINILFLILYCGENYFKLNLVIYSLSLKYWVIFPHLKCLLFMIILFFETLSQILGLWIIIQLIMEKFSKLCVKEFLVCWFPNTQKVS